MDNTITITTDDIVARKSYFLDIRARVEKDREVDLKEREEKLKDANINPGEKYTQVYESCRNELMTNKDKIIKDFRNGRDYYLFDKESKCNNDIFRGATVDAFSSVFRNIKQTNPKASFKPCEYRNGYYDRAEIRFHDI